MNATPLPKTMSAERIRRLRMQIGIKQKDAAIIFGVAKSTYNRYENGAMDCPDYVATGLIAMSADEVARAAVLGFWDIDQDGDGPGDFSVKRATSCPPHMVTGLIAMSASEKAREAVLKYWGICHA